MLSSTSQHGVKKMAPESALTSTVKAETRTTWEVLNRY